MKLVVTAVSGEKKRRKKIAVSSRDEAERMIGESVKIEREKAIKSFGWCLDQFGKIEDDHWRIEFKPVIAIFRQVSIDYQIIE